MAATDPIAITMTRAQWQRIYRSIMRADDSAPTARTLAQRIEAVAGVTSPSLAISAEDTWT